MEGALSQSRVMIVCKAIVDETRFERFVNLYNKLLYNCFFFIDKGQNIVCLHFCVTYFEYHFIL